MTNLLMSLGSIGFFQARAFLTTFVAALVVRFGEHLPLIKKSPLLELDHPQWMVNNTVLVVLGVLALLEFLAEENEDIRLILDNVDRHFKAIVAAAASYGLLGVAEGSALNQMNEAGIGQGVISIVTAFGVFGMASLRRSIFGFLRDIDDDDSLGLQKVLLRIENLWVVCGVLLLIVLPTLICFGVLLLTWLLTIIQKRLEKAEHSSRQPCPSCKEMQLPTALACSNCHAELNATKALGVLGQATSRGVQDRKKHANELLAARRCPHCAEKLAESKPVQTCKVCGENVLNTPDELSAFKDQIRKRLPATLTLSAVFGLIPFIGAVPAVVCFRVRLVSPFCRYLGAGGKFKTRLWIRLATFFLLAFQLAWPLSVVLLPFMAWLNYAFFAQSFEKRWNRQVDEL